MSTKAPQKSTKNPTMSTKAPTPTQPKDSNKDEVDAGAPPGDDDTSGSMSKGLAVGLQGIVVATLVICIY